MNKWLFSNVRCPATRAVVIPHLGSWFGWASDVLILSDCGKIVPWCAYVDVRDGDSNQALISVFNKNFLTFSLTLILIYFINGQNCIYRFKMVTIFNIQKTIRLEQLIIFVNQSHKTRAGKNLHNFSISRMVIYTKLTQ